jgi:RNA polymerase-binding transcription factor DksA
MLNKNIIEELKKALEEERREIEKTLGGVSEKQEKTNEWETKFPNMDENDDQSIEDAADEVEEFTTNIAIKEALENKLKDINEALEKIKNGTYGKCEECNKEIPLERLIINPSTKYCPGCENKK